MNRVFVWIFLPFSSEFSLGFLSDFFILWKGILKEMKNEVKMLKNLTNCLEISSIK